ncbi:hypothetical protein BGI42_02535 [Clostridium taeniosporum]|uniref:Transposase IS701-like DDE domain-containing protein n=1 Tax=Clostridium taeniosporum TaxID=394958 RepID=A0A1D7XH26_9CLOT|nr:hypothetical protein [Clostridium taeniosporum]AOR22651.1 hypothetical protein BGI42_02535 [Clostridium taeniosporum]
MISKGYNCKVSDIEELTSHTHGTSITRFLLKSNLNETFLSKSLKSLVLGLIWNKLKETKKPIYFIIDDTISQKTKLSSEAKNIIEKCSFHNFHLKGKTVYGHLELAQNLVESLPKLENKGYLLCDSWYSSKAIFNSSVKAGYRYIGALKIV